MPIKNYSSKTKPSTSLGKIQALLSEHGAKRVSLTYEDKKPVAVEFVMTVNGIDLLFRLTVNAQAMLRAMKNDKKVPKTNCKIEQAERTAWKNKLEWLHIQLSEIEAGQARIEQILLGYAITRDGDTVYNALTSGNLLQEEPDIKLIEE